MSRSTEDERRAGSTASPARVASPSHAHDPWDVPTVVRTVDIKYGHDDDELAVLDAPTASLRPEIVAALNAATRSSAVTGEYPAAAPDMFFDARPTANVRDQIAAETGDFSFDRPLAQPRQPSLPSFAEPPDATHEAPPLSTTPVARTTLPPAGGPTMPPRGRSGRRTVVAAACALACGAIGTGAWLGTRPVAPEPAPVIAAPAASAPRELPAPVVASAKAPVTTPPPATSPEVCIASHLPGAEPSADLGATCDEPDARVGVRAFRRAIVARANAAANGSTLRAWSRYGWQELAVYAALRAKCCPASAPPTRLFTPLSCDATAADAVGRAAATGTDADLTAALARFDGWARCAYAAGAAPSYEKQYLPHAGETAAFRELSTRLRSPAP